MPCFLLRSRSCIGQGFVAYIFLVSVCFCLFIMSRIAFPNLPISSSSSDGSPESHLDKQNLYSERRAELYENLATDLQKHGAKFLAGGNTSQSLTLSDIFTLEDGKVYPVLKPADPAVRAAVLHLKPQYAAIISQIVTRILSPYFSGAIWYQNPNLYHFSMFHASHHLEPVVATPDEVDAEARSVQVVAKRCCPLSIVLDRVVLTSTGVLLGCWQVVSGTEPAVIRDELRKALPRSPAKQLYDQVMLHTSFARILGPPSSSAKASIDSPSNVTSLFNDLVSQVNKELDRFEAVVEELWFVEELDVLALALNGRIKPWKFHLQCLAD